MQLWFEYRMYCCYTERIDTITRFDIQSTPDFPSFPSVQVDVANVRFPLQEINTTCVPDTDLTNIETFEGFSRLSLPTPLDAKLKECLQHRIRLHGLGQSLLEHNSFIRQVGPLLLIVLPLRDEVLLIRLKVLDSFTNFLYLLLKRAKIQVQRSKFVAKFGL